MFKILVVEDNRINQIVISKMLAPLGIEVDLADDGQQAVAAVLAKKYDLVFMDCQMPIMDGYAATGEIRKLESEGKLSKTIIVALTAHAMPQDRQKCFDAGMDDYASKPLNEDDLKKIVQKWLADRDVGSENVEIEVQASFKYISNNEFGKLIGLMGESMAELFKIYRSSMAELMVSLDAALAAKDYAAILRTAHTIKSPSRQLGALQVAEKAEEIETLARENAEPGLIEIKAKLLRELLSSTIAELEAYFAKAA